MWNKSTYLKRERGVNPLSSFLFFLINQLTSIKNMKAICIHNEGNDFDPEVGDIVDINEKFYISRVWRDGSEIDLEDPKRPGYFLPAETIMSLLSVGDQIEENYCHGMYLVV